MPLTTNDIAQFHELVHSPEAQYSNDARSIVHSMLLQALSGTQIRVYIFLQQHGEHTTIEIKRALNMKNYTVVTALHDLQFVKLIKKDKKGKGAKWKIR